MMSAQRRAALDPFYGLTREQARSLAEMLDKARVGELDQWLRGLRLPAPEKLAAQFGYILRNYHVQSRNAAQERRLLERNMSDLETLIYAGGFHFAAAQPLVRMEPRSPLGYQPEAEVDA